MAWKAFEVVFRLRSPMHIGLSKVGNLQRTRYYVLGRVIWGALTMRMTRDTISGPATDSRLYRDVGDKVHEKLAFTYFYPATADGNGGYEVCWSWDDESEFTYRFIRSYASTALSYPMQSAEEAMLHEVEFISPNTLDEGKPVFLVGYVFEKEGIEPDFKEAWKNALQKLQFGGERGYGWGDISLVGEPTSHSYSSLFGNLFETDLNDDRPVLSVQRCKPLLAHCPAKNISGDVFDAEGSIEPLVGREWNSQNKGYRYAGQSVVFNHICFTPGSIVTKDCRFTIGNYGIWYPIETSAS